MTGMKILKLWVAVILLGLLPVVSETQEEIMISDERKGEEPFMNLVLEELLLSHFTL